jgi:hypothetical protein
MLKNIQKSFGNGIENIKNWFTKIGNIIQNNKIATTLLVTGTATIGGTLLYNKYQKEQSKKENLISGIKEIELSDKYLNELVLFIDNSIGDSFYNITEFSKYIDEEPLLNKEQKEKKIIEKLKVLYFDNCGITFVQKKNLSKAPVNKDAVEILIGMITIQQLKEKINFIDTTKESEKICQQIIYLDIIKKLQRKIKELIDGILDKKNSPTLNNLINAIKRNCYYYKIGNRYYQTSNLENINTTDILSKIRLTKNNPAIKIQNTQKERLESSIINFFPNDQQINDIKKNIQIDKNHTTYNITTKYINENINYNLDTKKSIKDTASNIFSNIDDWITNNPINKRTIRRIREGREEGALILLLPTQEMI